MAKPRTPPVFDPARSLLEAYLTNDRINHYLLQNLAPEVWRADPPGGKGRTVAAMVAHIHNVRLMWLKPAGWKEIPDKLEGAVFTPADALRALRASARAIHDVAAASLAGDGRVKSFRPDAGGFLGYHIAHEAHHRGQIALLARLLGHPLPKTVTVGMWEWGSR